MMTVPNGSRKADIRKPTGRQAQRDEILESLKGKRTKKVGGAGTDAEGLELRKVAALEKLEQGERKKRKLGMHAVLCKRAEEAFDSQVSRLEKLAAMTKDKVRKLAYENKVAELLEAGPTMPDPEPDSEQEEQEEGEEAEEEEGAEDLGQHTTLFSLLGDTRHNAPWSNRSDHPDVTHGRGAPSCMRHLQTYRPS
jgi:hypothetical protein